MRPLLLCAGLVLGSVCTPSAARADYGDLPETVEISRAATSENETTNSSEFPAWDGRVGGSLGGFGTRHGGGGAFSLTATGRWTVLEVGGLFQAGIGPSWASFVTGAGLAGFALQLGTGREGGVRFDVLAELGVDSFYGVGGGLLSSGASASVAMYGIRLGIGYRFARRRMATGYIGMWLTAEQDASTQASFADCGLFNCGGQETVQIGGDSRIGLHFGGGVDFGPR